LAHYQHIIFGWIAAQSGLVGLVVFAAGLLSAFYGFRMLRLLLALYAGGLGCVAGFMIADNTILPAMIVAPALAIAGVAAAVAWPGGATVVVSGLTWGVFGGYLATQIGLKGIPVWIAGGLLGLAGTVLALVCREAMAVVLTSLHGASWIILGFAGLAIVLMPTVGETFQSWASSQSLVVPILLLMLVATAYSYQANERQGDIRTGPRGGLPRAPENPR
jgi:hypothetical protein